MNEVSTQYANISFAERYWQKEASDDGFLTKAKLLTLKTCLCEGCSFINIRLEHNGYESP